MFIAIRSIYLQMFSKKCSPLCGLSGPPGQSLWPLRASWPISVASLWFSGLHGHSRPVSRDFSPSHST